MEKIVIVGAGHSAGQLVASLRQRKFAGAITLIGTESWLPYQRPPLSKRYLSGVLEAERLFVKPANFYQDNDVDVRLSTTVTSIDRAQKDVVLNSDERISYDKLVLAVGGQPRRLSLPGANLDGVCYLRNIDDVDRIRRGLRADRHLCIIGAGYIGLEVAAVAIKLGVKVTVVEMAERVMKRVVAEEMSDFYQQQHESHGVEFRLSANITALRGNSAVETVVLDDGEELNVDLVVTGIGIIPSTELADAAGLEVDDGIVVDDHCQTSDPDVFAIGDCTHHPNDLLRRRVRLESVHNALEQAKVTAANLCGDDTAYSEIPWFWSDQYDLKLQIAGLSQGFDQIVLRGDPQQKSFACFYLERDRLIAVDAVNSPKNFVQARKLIAERVRPNLAKLAQEDIALSDTLD